MSDIEAAWVNLMEASTVTVTSAATGYPAYRLYDRFMARMWKATSAADQTIQIDQGTSGSQALNALIIPEGHNLDGCVLYWEWSDNGADWTEVTHGTVSGSGLIQYEAGSDLTHRYWRLRITGAAAAPQMGECFFTQLRQFAAVQPENVQEPQEWLARRSESPSGVASWLVLGGDRWQWGFDLPYMTTADHAVAAAWMTAWAGAKPFLFVDYDGTARFCEIVGKPVVRRHPGTYKSLSLQLQEVLG